MLLDMLSSRSYLELLSDGQEEAEISRIDSLSKEEAPGIKDGQERRLRPRTRRASRAQEISNQVSEDSNSIVPGRPVRKRGRPRLETAKDATAIEVDPSRLACDGNLVDQFHRNVVSRSDGHNAPIVSRKR